jgi:hypothetical protein
MVLEASYSFFDNRGFKEAHSVPELLLRYGLTDRLELRLGWNAEVGGPTFGEGSLPAGDRLVREYTLLSGLKVRTADQAGWVPRSAVIVQGFTPTGGSAGASTATEFLAAYAAGWEFRRGPERRLGSPISPDSPPEEVGAVCPARPLHTPAARTRLPRGPGKPRLSSSSALMDNVPPPLIHFGRLKRVLPEIKRPKQTSRRGASAGVSVPCSRPLPHRTPSDRPCSEASEPVPSD